MPADRPSPPAALVLGLRAGLAWALADALAAGPLRTPWRLHLLTLGLGLALGLAGGLLGALSARRAARAGAGPGWTLCLATALSGLALASKELEGDARLLGGALVGLCALACVPACAGRPGGWSLDLARLALVPLASLVVHGVPGGAGCELLLVGAHAAVPLAAWLLGRARLPAGHAPALLGALTVGVVLVLPQRILDRPPPPSAGAPAPTAAPRPDAPDLVLVVIDTLRADAVGTGGALDALARAGVQFTSCISTAPWTLPSMGSLLTGRVPSAHGATHAFRPLPADLDTLAEILARAGYRTAAFTGGAFVGRAFGLDQGFEHFDDAAEFGFRPYRLHAPLAWRVAKNRYLPLEPLLRWVDEQPGFAGVRRAAEAWLAARDDARPAFLLLHTYEVHDYYLYDPWIDARVDREAFGLAPRFRRRLSFHPRELADASAEDLRWFRARYDARLARVDAELGAFVRGLADAPRETLLVVVSDHGEGFDAARGRVHHGGRLHDDLLRVPLLFHGPRRWAGSRRVDRQVSTLDVAPTLLELALGRPPDGAAAGSGRSLVPLLAGGEADAGAGGPAADAAAWSEEHANGRDAVSLRRPGWKLVAEGEARTWFDLVEDPLEEHPRSAVPPAALDELRRRLATVEERTAADVELDAATREHLRRLGYLE